jgi:hypothetical protein
MKPNLSNGHLSDGHLSNDQLIEQLYAKASSLHVESCPECALRLGRLEERRSELAARPPVSNDFLAGQRRRIYARLGEPVPSRMRWAPATLAAACLLVAGMFVYRPMVTTPPVHTEVADAQLFSDVYLMEESTEPIAAAPIHALFEDNQ